MFYNMEYTYSFKHKPKFETNICRTPKETTKRGNTKILRLERRVICSIIRKFCFRPSVCFPVRPSFFPSVPTPPNPTILSICPSSVHACVVLSIFIKYVFGVLGLWIYLQMNFIISQNSSAILLFWTITWCFRF